MLRLPWEISIAVLLVCLALSCQDTGPSDSGQLTSARQQALQSLDKYSEQSDTAGMISSYLLLTRAAAESGDFEQAVETGTTGVMLCRFAGDLQSEYQLNNLLSRSYFALGYGFEQTLSHQERQLAVVEEMGDDAAKALVYNNYGYDATVAGTVPLYEAMRYSNFANDYYAGEEGQGGRWYTLMNLAWQNRLLGQLEIAEALGRRSVALATNAQDRHAVVETIAGLGETLLEQGRIEEAEIFYTNGLSWAERALDRDKYVFDVYYARYQWETGDRGKAISRLEKAVAFLQDSEVFYEMLARAYLAKYYIQAGRPDAARKQIAVFDNPLASYFSQEATVIARIAEAELLTPDDPEAARKLRAELQAATRRSGAILLQQKIAELPTAPEN